MKMYQVIAVYDDETGYGLHQNVFKTREEAEAYAENTIEMAESEYGTEVDRDQNVYAVVTNSWNEAKGFIEVIELNID